MLDVRNGRRASPKMHPFIEDDAVSVDDLANIAAYLATLPVPTDNGKGSGRLLELGKHLYDRDCATCHGRKGEGNAAKFYPRVAGQHYNYLVREAKECRDLGRRNSNAEMIKVIRNYVDSDIEAVSDYMSRLSVPHRKRK
jgi:cytochrome c553